MPSKNKAPKVAKTKASKKSKIVDTVLVTDEQVVAPVAAPVAPVSTPGGHASQLRKNTPEFVPGAKKKLSGSG